MTGRLLQVAPEDVPAIWPALAPKLEAALAYEHGQRMVEDLKADCEAGETQLWVYGDSTAVSEVVNFPRYKLGRVIAAGGDIKDFKATWPMFCAWAKERGCRTVEVAGRKGWLDALGLDYAYTVGRKELD